MATERMLASLEADTGALYGALAKAQGAFPAIPRDREVKVQMKSGGSYTFRYAPLDTILEKVRGPLAANGLALSQLLDGADLVTMLLHESGASLSGRIPIPGSDNVQGYGSTITYLRRYAIQAILGIASEEDDDGNASAGNRASTATPRPSVAPRAVPDGPALSQADIASLHAQFAEPDPDDVAAEAFAALTGAARPDALDVAFGDLPDNLDAPTGGMTTGELFRAAEEAGIPKARLTLSAKGLFGANRWKVADLTDAERAQLWADVAP